MIPMNFSLESYKNVCAHGPRKKGYNKAPTHLVSGWVHLELHMQGNVVIETVEYGWNCKWDRCEEAGQLYPPGQEVRHKTAYRDAQL